MSTDILKSIFSLNLQSEDNESEYQEDIFDLPPLNNKSSSNIDYTFYDNSFDHQINKITEHTREYEDDNLYMFSDFYSSTTSILTDTTYPFYEPMTFPDIPSLGSPLDLISNKLDSDSESEICSQVKAKPRGRKRKSIPKIDNININISQPIRKSSSSCDDDIITIGIYTKAERREKIKRYKEKKRNPVKNRVLYQCRKRFADTRERVGGRFVKKSK